MEVKSVRNCLLASLVVRAMHHHRAGVGSIPAGEPVVDEFKQNVCANSCCDWLILFCFFPR